MIKFEDMPKSAQKSYKTTNSVRKIAMFVGWIATIGVVGSMLIGTLFNGDSGVLSMALIVSLFYFFIYGYIHAELLAKGTGPLGFFIWIFCYIFAAIFLIADTILFVRKKPLIYPFENKCFLRTAEAQAEMEAEYKEAVISALSGTNNSSVAMKDIQKLKEMLEQGLITEEEFDSKKKEVLERI